MILRLQNGGWIIISLELVERIRKNNGQVESIQIEDGVWVIEAFFPDVNTSCPRCFRVRSRPYGWRKERFSDRPTTNGLAVALNAWRQRLKCRECGKTFLGAVPYLMNYGRITLGMQDHLAHEILHFPSIRELARVKRLSARTVMLALEAAVADTQLPHGQLDALALRSIAVGDRTFWLGIDPSTLKTKILAEGNEPSALTDLVVHVADFSPSEIDIPINPELASLLRTLQPKARLTVSIPEILDLTEDILKQRVQRLSYKLRNEGLKSQQAQALCSIRSASLPQAEQLLFDRLSNETPFWGSYQFKDYFHSQLEAGDISYRQAIQEALEQTIEVVRPVFLPTYRQLILLDQLGVETRRDQEYEQLHWKLNRLKERLRKQGTRFEFPLLSAIIGLYFLGFGGPGLLEAFKQTLVEIRDVFWVPSSFWLSDIERRAILLA